MSKQKAIQSTDTVLNNKQGFKTLVVEVLLRTLEAIDTPVSLGISIRIRSGDLSDLPKFSPLDYLVGINLPVKPFDRGVEAYKLDAQALACVKKLSSEFIPTQEDLKAKAVKSFIQVEESVKQSNIRLANMHSMLPRDRAILMRAKGIVHRVLGENPYNRHGWTLKFGPGKTLSNTGKNPSHIIAKIGNMRSNTITPRAIRYFHAAVTSNMTLYRWACSSGILHPVSLRFNRNAFVEVNYEKFSTVPKDFTKLRPIGVGPDINVILQLNVGSWIRADYDRYFKTDLRMVPKEHRDLVEADSRVGAYATIDLQNASSTICSNLVRFLVPSDWWSLLSALRTEYTLLPDETLHHNEMMSAMGNGFTFELESLIFRALVQATLDYAGDPGYVSVYGDDIICPSHRAKDVIATLEVCGFTINKEKTFTGNYPGFKESCGSDWMDGVDVRPIYFKEFSHNVQGLYSLCNRITALSIIYRQFTRSNTSAPSAGLVGFAERLRVDLDKDMLIDQTTSEFVVYNKRFIKPFRLALQAIPAALRFGGPTFYGDSVIHGLKPQVRVRNSQARIKALIEKPSRVTYDRLGHAELQLTYVRLGLPSEGITPRGETAKVLTGSLPLIGRCDIEWW